MRFEPTPGNGGAGVAAPAYAPFASQLPGATPGSVGPSDAAQDRLNPTQADRAAEGSAVNPRERGLDEAAVGAQGQTSSRLPWLVGALALLALAAAPATRAWRRRRRLSAAARGSAEAAWSEVLDTAADLGRDRPDRLTPGAAGGPGRPGRRGRRRPRDRPRGGTGPVRARPRPGGGVRRRRASGVRGPARGVRALGAAQVPGAAHLGAAFGGQRVAAGVRRLGQRRRVVAARPAAAEVAPGRIASRRSARGYCRSSPSRRRRQRSSRRCIDVPLDLVLRLAAPRPEAAEPRAEPPTWVGSTRREP